MTINTFKKLCLKANTKKSEEIHNYFIQLEETFIEIINEESIELKLLLEQKEQQEKNIQEQLVQKNKQKEIEKMELLLKSFKRKSICYLILIAYNLYKFGNTDDLEERLRAHKREIGRDIILVFCIESKDNELLEQKLKDYLRTTKYRKEQIIKGHNQTELIEIKDITIIQDKLIKFNKKIDEDKEALQLETELKLKEIELKEIEIQKVNENKELELQKAKNEELKLQLELLKLQQIILASSSKITYIEKMSEKEMSEEEMSEEEIVEKIINKKELIKQKKRENMRKYRQSEKYKQKIQQKSIKIMQNKKNIMIILRMPK